MSTVTYTAAQILSPHSTALFDELVCLLDLSFANDPMTNWLLKNFNHEKFPRKLTYYHRAVLRLALLSGARIIAIKEDRSSDSTVRTLRSNGSMDTKHKNSFKAVSILIPPSGNKTFESTITYFRAGILSFAWHTGLRPVSRLSFHFMPKLDKIISDMYPPPNQHRRHDHWHLLVLAARPDCQGQGLGRTLMLECQGVVAAAAVEAQKSGRYVSPLYLESSTVGSKRLYNRLGFVDRGTMEYGKVNEGETVSTDMKGKVSGAKLFAMMWTP